MNPQTSNDHRSVGEGFAEEVLDARIAPDQIAAVYNRIAGVYDLWGTLTETRARGRALDLAQIRDGQTVLEVAVGTGLAFEAVVARNPSGRNIGIDLSPGMLARARRRLATAPPGAWSLEIGSARDLPLAAGSVDVLLNNYMFDLVAFDAMDEILNEFKRVLRPGGRLVLVNMTLPEKFGAGIYDRVYRLSPRLMGGCRGVRMRARLERRGFVVETREYLQQLWFPSEVLVARR